MKNEKVMPSTEVTTERSATWMEYPVVVNIAIPAIFLLLWSTGFSVVKIGIAYADPLTFLALRYACVVAILLPVQFLLKSPFPSTLRSWADLCIIGFLIQFVYFGGTYLSLRAGLSAGSLALIVSLQPVLVGIAAPLWLQEHVSRRQWVGLASGFLGAAIVIASKSSVELTSIIGIVLAVVSLAGMTLGVLYERKTASSEHVITSTLIQSLTGLVFVFPLAALLEPLHVEWTTTMFLSLGYLVICNSIIAVILLLFLVRRRQAAKVSTLFFLVPPCAAIAANMLVGEAMPALAWLGIAVATIGVWISNR